MPVNENKSLLPFAGFLLPAGFANLFSRGQGPWVDTLMTCVNDIAPVSLLLFWTQSVFVRLLPSGAKTCTVSAAVLLLQAVTARADEEADLFDEPADILTGEPEDELTDEPTGEEPTEPLPEAEADETCFSHFTGVEIDGETLENGTDYTAAAGSTVVTLKAAALERLDPGTHTVSVRFDDGTAETELTIVPEPGTEPGQTDDTTLGASGGNSSGTSSTGKQSPGTGDSSRMGVWAAMLALSVVGLGVAVLPTLKRKDER